MLRINASYMLCARFILAVKQELIIFVCDGKENRHAVHLPRNTHTQAAVSGTCFYVTF